MRCKPCQAKVTPVDGILARNTGNHTHPPDHTDVDVRYVVENIHKRCRDELTPIPKLYEEEIASIRAKEWNHDTTNMAKNIPTFQRCKTSLYRERSKLRPNLPSSAANIELEEEWTQTTSGEKFLQVDVGPNQRMLVFATRSALQHICVNPVIYGDETFYTCPRFFHQLFTFHGFIDGAMYPLVFAFLPGKSTDVYETFIRQLQDKCEGYGLHLQPDAVFLDYEMASRNAVLRVLPNTVVKACFIHYTQCIWRKVQATGLANTYKEVDSVHTLVRRVSVLPLVPEDDVEDVWFQALEDIGNEDLPVDVTTFTDYVTEQWVDKDDKGVWNHFATEGPRTTNHLEGWHIKLKKAVRHAHPNIFSIIQTIQQIEAAGYVRMLQYEAGGARPVKRRRYRQIELRLRALKMRLENGEMRTMDYADEASKLLHI